MTESNDSARIPLPGPDDVSGETRVLYDNVMASRGMDFMANVFRGLGNSPAAMEKVTSLGEYARFKTGFDDELRELLILTTAQCTGSAYEWTHHYHIAEKLGIDKETLNSIGSAEIEQRPNGVGAAVRFARLVASNEQIDDQTFEAVRDKFGDKGLIDMTVITGYYVMLGLYTNAMRIPCEVELVAFSR
jgi:4-carboxymuconolactone decarboxylase